MQDLIRFIFLLLVALIVLFSKLLFKNFKFFCQLNFYSLDLVQCRSVFTETMAGQKRNINYMELCMFRKSRLCDCKF